MNDLKCDIKRGIVLYGRLSQTKAQSPPRTQTKFCNKNTRPVFRCKRFPYLGIGENFPRKYFDITNRNILSLALYNFWNLSSLKNRSLLHYAHHHFAGFDQLLTHVWHAQGCIRCNFLSCTFMRTTLQ